MIYSVHTHTILSAHTHTILSAHTHYTQCTPILLYGLDAAGADEYELKRLCNSYNRAFMKIFKSFDNTIILQCQWFTYNLYFRHLAELNRIKHLFRIKKLVQSNIDSIFDYFLMSSEEIGRASCRERV